MGFVSCKSWLSWLISVYCILQVSGALYVTPEDRDHNIVIECENVKVQSNHTRSFIEYYYSDYRPAAVTHFNAKDEECALGSLGDMKPLSEFFSQFDVYEFKTTINIPQEKRHELTGPFDCNKTSVRNYIISFNESYEFFLDETSVKINESGTYCSAVRPLTSLGASAHAWASYRDYDPDLVREEYWHTVHFNALICSALLLLPACVWIYLLRSQPAKVLPIQYGLLLHIVVIAFEFIDYAFDPEVYDWTYTTICNQVEFFIRCLLLLLASFGIGVWRPVQFVQNRYIFMAIGGFSTLVFINVYENLNYSSRWAWASFRSRLNSSIIKAVYLSSIFVLYKEWKQPNAKSECSAKVCKRFLVYCVAVFILRPWFVPRIYRDFYSLLQESYVNWLIDYIVEIIIPCYIWYPSQNEQLAYKPNVEI